MDNGLDLSILDNLNIPNIDVKTTKKETINLPESVDTDSDNNETAPISVADEVDSFEELINKQKLINKEVIDDDTDDDSTDENVENNDSNDNQDSVVKVWSEWAKEKGLIDYTDEEFEDSEEFIEKKYIENVTKGIEEYKEELPDVIKELINNYEDGVPLKELIESKSKQIEYSKISIDDLSDDDKKQEDLIRAWLEVQDFEEEEIEDKLTDYKDSGLMEKEAKTALNKLKKYEEKYQKELHDLTIKNKQLQEQEYINNIKKLESDILSKDEIIEGIPLTKESKNRVFAGITKKDNKGYTEIQKKMSNPEMQLKVAQFVLLHDGKIDDIVKQAKTKVAKETKKTVTTYKDTSKLGTVDINIIKKALKTK